MSLLSSGRALFLAFVALTAAIALPALWFLLRPAAPTGFVEYPMPHDQDTPTAISAAPDGSVWFTIDSAAAIGRIKGGKLERFPKEGNNLEPIGLAATADGGAWFADVRAHKLLHVTPDGKVTGVALDTPTVRIGRLAVAPDGAVWFAEGTMHSITKLQDGVLTRHSIEMVDGAPYGVAVGRDGTVWATLQSGNRVLQITPDGDVRSIELPRRGVGPSDIAVGPDGTVWLITFRGNSIGRLKDGKILETELDGENAGLSGLAVSAEGDVWFGMIRRGSLGRLRNGELRTFPLPRERARPYSVTIDGDDNIWYADISGHVGMLAADVARR